MAHRRPMATIKVIMYFKLINFETSLNNIHSKELFSRSKDNVLQNYNNGTLTNHAVNKRLLSFKDSVDPIKVCDLTANAKYGYFTIKHIQTLKILDIRSKTNKQA